MSALFDLTGTTALVTGANTGLGQAIAVALAEAGAGIVAVGRSAMDETQALIQEKGRPFKAVAADLATLEPIDRIVAEASELGRIDVLVNNAGIIRRADALDFTEADWDAVVDVNLKSAFFLSQAVARRMLADGRGGCTPMSSGSRCWKRISQTRPKPSPSTSCRSRYRTRDPWWCS